jgi:hypothetical protein
MTVTSYVGGSRNYLTTSNEWCRRGESNPRPRDYETLALPLSYAGTSAAFDAKGLLREVSRHQRARRNIMGLQELPVK